jgi:hypothetical protein
VRATDFDRTYGPAALRTALLRGEHPDSVLARTAPAVAAFRARIAPFLMYR